MTASGELKAGYVSDLIWYLEARNWAHEKMRFCPHGSQMFDVRMHHSLYFSNLCSAVDHVRDYLLDSEREREVFIASFKVRFSNEQDYQYVRELRNAIVHRGLDPTTEAHSDGTTLHVLCPSVVQDRKVKNSYIRPFKYLHELAAHCDMVINPAIAAVLEKLGAFEPAPRVANEEDIRAAINNSEAMPNWAKELAIKSIGEWANPSVTSHMAAHRVKKLRTLLGSRE